MNGYKGKEGYLAGDKRCIYCCAHSDYLHLLNPKSEVKGGVDSYYFRCGQCRRYFVEYWINGELKTVLAS